MPRPRTIKLLTERYKELSTVFYRYLIYTGYAVRSCKKEQLYIEEFLHWLECRGRHDLSEVRSWEVQKFYDYLSCRPNWIRDGILNPKSTYDHMRSVRKLFTMLQHDGKGQHNPVNTLKFNYPQDYKRRNPLTQDEMKQLYAVCETAWERTILSLAYGCGLRAAEMEALNITDVRLRDKVVVVEKGKGSKRRVVPMSPGVIRDLSDYFYMERQYLTSGRDYRAGENAFMLHSRGGRMRAFTYNKYLKRLIEKTENQEVKNKEISLHNLRHSIATHLIEEGLAVEQVRQFLGHSLLESTQIYTHISRGQIRELIGV